MSYKTILVHVDDSGMADTRTLLAASIAVQQGAHLVGAATTGMARMIDGVSDLYYANPDLVGHVTALRNGLLTRSEEALERFTKFARSAALRSYDSLLLNEEPAAGLSLRARYADLTVISQCNPNSTFSILPPDFPENVLLSSGCPTLVVPYAGQFTNVDIRPLIAWDAGAAATRAVRDALPLLRKAGSADIVVFNPVRFGDVHGVQAGHDIALFLTRHDVNVKVHRISTQVDVGNALLSLTEDLNSDLVVMGCYGQSRVREILLGGVTRTMLQMMTVPVLMSH